MGYTTKNLPIHTKLVGLQKLVGSLMKIPMSPPKIDFNQIPRITPGLIPDILRPTNDKGEYLPWDKLRHISLPGEISYEHWWFFIKLARKSLYKPLPFEDKYGNPFVLATPGQVLFKLHSIDRSSGNTIQSPISALNTQMRDTYLVQSLMNEAITSSQLEGAATTRKVAKEMLRSSRKPRDVSEQMIYNNYQAMEFVREIKNEALTTNIILEFHRILTKDTLDDPNTAGFLRNEADDIHVWDDTDQILHTPPKAEELSSRLERICKFANAPADQENSFIHPVIKAIVLHFMLAYDHPFVDGNGRTARALFYWSMAHQGYWLMEFISISEIIKRAPKKYAKSYIYTETDDNDLTYFVLHQLDIILRAIKILYEHIDKQCQEISETERLLHGNLALQNRLNYRQVALIKDSLKNPHRSYRIEIHRQYHKVTYDTARTDLLNLAELGLLLKQQMGKAFIFMAPDDLKKRIEIIK